MLLSAPSSWWRRATAVSAFALRLFAFLSHFQSSDPTGRSTLSSSSPPPVRRVTGHRLRLNSGRGSGWVGESWMSVNQTQLQQTNLPDSAWLSTSPNTTYGRRMAAGRPLLAQGNGLKRFRMVLFDHKCDEMPENHARLKIDQSCTLDPNPTINSNTKMTKHKNKHVIIKKRKSDPLNVTRHMLRPCSVVC